MTSVLCIPTVNLELIIKILETNSKEFFVQMKKTWKCSLMDRQFSLADEFLWLRSNLNSRDNIHSYAIFVYFLYGTMGSPRAINIVKSLHHHVLWR